jgi:hypothetical protein
MSYSVAFLCVFLRVPDIWIELISGFFAANGPAIYISKLVWYIFSKYCWHSGRQVAHDCTHILHMVFTRCGPSLYSKHRPTVDHESDLFVPLGKEPIS